MTFVKFHREWAGHSGRALGFLFDSLPPDAREAMWDELAERCRLRIDAELEVDRQRHEPWCPGCHDRRIEHEPGCCPKHRGAEKGTPTSSSTGAPGAGVHDDPLKRIPAHEYLPALADVEVSSTGRCRCPMPDHPDEHPSAKAYGTEWHCFACGAGGSIIDVGAALYGIDPTGQGYWEIRDRLVADLEGVLDG